MLFDEKNKDGMSQAFLNTLTMAIPSTIIPIAMAAFAAYALAWMNFRGNALVIAAVVAGLAVPPQVCLDPHSENCILTSVSARAFWACGSTNARSTLPFAIFLLYSYMARIPREIVENAKLDGANDFQIFYQDHSAAQHSGDRLVRDHPVFCGRFNDLMGPKVFLLDNTGDNVVVTEAIIRLLGPYGGQWEIIATGAFISMALPLVVFFAMQRYFFAWPAGRIGQRVTG